MVICLQPSQGFSFPLIFLLTLHMQCPQTFQKNDHFFSALWQPVSRPAARGDIQSQQVLSCGAERASERLSTEYRLLSGHVVCSSVLGCLSFLWRKGNGSCSPVISLSSPVSRWCHCLYAAAPPPPFFCQYPFLRVLSLAEVTGRLDGRPASWDGSPARASDAWRSRCRPAGHWHSDIRLNVHGKWACEVRRGWMRAFPPWMLLEWARRGWNEPRLRMESVGWLFLSLFLILASPVSHCAPTCLKHFTSSSHVRIWASVAWWNVLHYPWDISRTCTWESACWKCFGARGSFKLKSW